MSNRIYLDNYCELWLNSILSNVVDIALCKQHSFYPEIIIVDMTPRMLCFSARSDANGDSC